MAPESMVLLLSSRHVILSHGFCVNRKQVVLDEMKRMAKRQKESYRVKRLGRTVSRILWAHPVMKMTNFETRK